MASSILLKFVNSAQSYAAVYTDTTGFALTENAEASAETGAAAINKAAAAEKKHLKHFIQITSLTAARCALLHSDLIQSKRSGQRAKLYFSFEEQGSVGVYADHTYLTANRYFKMWVQY